MNREIEDGMGCAGLVGLSPDEREIERLDRKLRIAKKALQAIAVNTCCASCQEAALVARVAIENIGRSDSK